MKKSQGRKPRRPRQPLKIISPEAAAQMEEEQVWTDFEEGDREEEEEEEEEEDEEEEEENSNYGELLQSSKDDGESGSYQMSNDSVVMSLGMHQIANGKTGLIARSKKITDKSNISEGGQVEQVKEWEDTLQGDQSNYQHEIVEEEVVMEDVGPGNLRTYVFQPPPEHNTLPKVNIRSSWNTINIDLKSLEMASELIIPETTSYAGEEIVEGPMKTELTNMDTGCKEVVGDHITPEEVITICSSMDNVSEEVETRTIQPPTSNPDWFTVKKPIKCYGRPGYGVTYQQDAVPAASCAQPDPKTNGNSQGVFVVEYVHSNDGRLAKVYRASASLIPKGGQQGSLPQVITVPSRGSVPVIVGSGVNRTPQPITMPLNSIRTTSKLVPQASERQGVLDAGHQDTATTQGNNRLTITYDKESIHKQVVNSVGKDNTDESKGLVTCREPQTPAVTLHSSPSVVVTTVPHVTEAQHLPGSHGELFPWSSQSLPDNTQVTTYSIGTGVEGTQALKNDASNEDDRNHLTYPLITQEVEQYVGVQDDILLDNVEIIESFSVGDEQIIVNTGIVDGEGQDVCGTENMTQLTQVQESDNTGVKMEELVPCESGMLDGTAQYVDHLLHHNIMVTNEQNTATTQDAPQPQVNMGVVH